MSDEDPPVLDQDKVDELRNLLGEGPDGYEGLVDTFVDRMPEVIADAKSAASEGRLEDVESLAHKVKGEASTLGAAQLSKLAKSIEEGAREETLADPEASVEELADAFETTKKAFEEL
jgi:HPt (histidine-containing phosphotransfer) domain-containing protein